MASQSSQYIKPTTAPEIIEDYFAWTKRREGCPSQAILHICEELRPDRCGNLVPLEKRRELHLKIFAWCEWWAGSINQLPKMAKARGLGEALEIAQAPFGMDSAKAWVENRVANMQQGIIEWEKGDNVIPVYNSLTPVQYFEYEAVEPSGMGG